jgi:transposase
MMGIKARTFGPLPPVSLDDLVPTDHFSRQLERTLDLVFVRDLVGDAYAGIGRPSVDPVVFFKRQLALFFEGLRSERQLLRVVADRLSLRWRLGYDLTEALPDHSSLTRIRDRYGLDLFRRFFETITEQCMAANLVWGRELFIDSTKVEANAALDSLQPRFAVEAHLARLFPTDEAPPAGPATHPIAHDDPTQARSHFRGSSPRLTSRHWPSARHPATTGSDASAGPIGRTPAAPIGVQPISASAPPIPTPRRCRLEAVRRTWGITITTSLTAGRPGSS